MAQKFELGLGTGSMFYKGEVTYNFNPVNAQPYISAIGRYNFSHTVVAKVDLGIGNVSANANQSDDILIKNLPNPASFKTQIWEASLGLEYNFIDYRKYKSRNRGTPYLVGGFGIFTYDTPNRYEGQGKPGVELCIPFGIGYKYVLSRHWNIGVEYGARKTFTGYIDGVHNRRPNGSSVLKVETQRGFYDKNDWYMAGKVMLTYTLYRVDCPFEVPSHIK